MATFFSNLGRTLDRTIGSLTGVGREVKTPPTAPTVITGGTAVSAFGGWLRSPERNPNLQGRRRFRTYGECAVNIEIVGSALRYYLALVKSAEWSFQPPEGETSRKAQKYADIVSQQFKDLDTPFADVIEYQAGYHFWDFRTAEWVMRPGTSDGVMALQDVEPRPNDSIERWDLDPAGHLLGVTQRLPDEINERYLYRDRLFYLRDKTISTSPDGLGLLRHVMKSYVRLERYLQLEGYGFEGDICGMPVVKIPYAALDAAVKLGATAVGGMSKAQRDKTVSNLEALIHDHQKNPHRGVAVDSMPYQNPDESWSTVPMYGFDTIQSTNTVQTQVDRAITRIEHAMAWVLNAEGLLLGSAKVGTNALGDDKTDRAMLTANSALRTLAGGVDRDLIKGAIGRWNGWDPKLCPVAVPAKLSRDDVLATAQVIVAQAQAGQPLRPADKVFDKIRGRLGLPDAPEPTPEELALEAAAKMPPPLPGTAPGTGSGDKGKAPPPNAKPAPTPTPVAK